MALSTPGIDYDAMMQAYQNQRLGKVETYNSCNCVGPRNGEPLCRCRMANVKIVDGRYVETRDYGPAPTAAPLTDAFDRAQRKLGKDVLPDSLRSRLIGDGGTIL